jgi:hypothetical protein
MHHQDPTRAYVAGHIAEGMTKAEIIRLPQAATGP